MKATVAKNKYEEALAALTTPEPFDPRVFIASDTCPQPVCDFVLSLSLVFNDFRDIVLGHQFVQTILPTATTPSKELGQAGGISEHLFRVMMALIHELLVLIDNSRTAMSQDVFRRVVKTLHPEAKQAWESLVAVKVGPKSKDPVARLVHFARNKVAFHYDSKAISAGYRARFNNPSLPPFISQAPSMAGTRFYFADAAAQRLMRDTADQTIVDDFFSGELAIFLTVNHAVREVVRTFVNFRVAQLADRPPNSR